MDGQTDLRQSGAMLPWHPQNTVTLDNCICDNTVANGGKGCHIRLRKLCEQPQDKPIVQGSCVKFKRVEY